MSTRTALVIGANGRFGAAAVQAFAAAGWQVLAQMRREPAHPLPAGVRALRMALDDPRAVAAAAAGAEVVVHAGNPDYTRWDTDLMPLFHAALAVAQHRGAVFMMPGNVYNYGTGNLPRWIDEDTPQLPSTAKGRWRVAIEDELHAGAAAGLPVVLIRAGDFFGGGSGTWLDQAIAKDIARGRLVYPGPLDLAHAWAYLPDLACAFVAVADRGPVPGYRAMHFAGHTLTGAEFLAALQTAAGDLGLHPAGGWRVRRFPWPLVGAAGLVNPMLRELWRMRYLWQLPHGLRGHALQAAAGPLATTPIVPALRQTLADWLVSAHGAATAAGALSSGA